jgi:hypothetical protein
MTAWLSYDSLSGRPMSVSWEKMKESCVEITTELAESFMLGTSHIHDYSVDISNKTLVKRIPEKRLPRVFWSLKILDGSDSGLNITAELNKVYITLKDVSNLNLMLFATIKNDPSWLINSWDLNDYKVVDGMITVWIKDATDFSYYIGKTR